MADPDTLEEPESGPPWIDRRVQQHIAWRNGDIVISVPPKSGTTWTMNIVHQLRSSGDPDFLDVYAEVPWLEACPSPAHSLEVLTAAIDQLPADRRRAFKTHAAPGVLPFWPRGEGSDVRYVVVVRNPDEVVASVRPFLASHTPEFIEQWGLPGDMLTYPTFADFFDDLGLPTFGPRVFDFVARWWPHRHDARVLMLHYSDMVADHGGSIRKVADFLGFAPSRDDWERVLEYTSFSWMKAHSEKFDLRSVSQVPWLRPGAMIRRGRAGVSQEDGITPAMSKAIAEVGRELLPDAGAFQWCYEGGPVPG